MRVGAPAQNPPFDPCRKQTSTKDSRYSPSDRVGHNGSRNGGSAVSAYKITATNPPTIIPACTVSQNGQGSPWVTTTDGINNAIVWVVGAGGDQRLHGYNRDTGAVIYAGGGANELMANTRKWNTGIAARGRIYFAASNKVYAFVIP